MKTVNEKRRKWTKREDEIIIKHYLTDEEKAIKLLKPRKESAIIQRAYKLGVKQGARTYWKKQEEEIVKKYYLTDKEKIYKLLPDKTKTNIKNKAYWLGLSKTKWTQEEDDILKKHYPENMHIIKELLVNRTENAIKSRVLRLKKDIGKTRKKLRVNKKWTEQEDNIIRQYYSNNRHAIEDMLPGRTLNSITLRASKLEVTAKESRILDNKIILQFIEDKNVILELDKAVKILGYENSEEWFKNEARMAIEEARGR